MKSLLSILFVFSNLILFGQEYNRLDEQGRKQGPYKKYYESAKDKVFYTGQFKNDQAYGTFTYFYKNGKVKSVMNYAKNGVVRSELFSDKGAIIAAGKYVNKQKDSTWTYFGDGYIQTLENWNNGKKNGAEVVFFAKGDTSEVKFWDNDKLNGPFRQYFTDGKLKMTSTMVDDEYVGETTFYHANGRVDMKGKYVSGYRNGSWYHYNKDGSLRMQVLYEGGDVIKEKRENGLFKEFFEPEMPQSEITYQNGLKHGPFVIYHEGAQRIRVEELDKLSGEVIPKEIVKGIEPKMSGEYRNDKLHGKITHYNKVGKVTKTENFDHGTLVNK